PTSSEEWLIIPKIFTKKWNFPLCIGVIDGKHMRSPANAGSSYYNYKGYHSIVLLAMV
ncbi:hypothetical protein CAPTEDRAFT_111992, partial [Capitella teleta]